MPQGKVQLRGLKSLEYRNIIISKAKIIEVYDRCKYSGNQNNLSLKSVKFADMPHEKIYNNFTGGLDTDSQENFVKPTDWRYALNIRAGVAYANREGAITNLKGNTEVAYALPSGTNTCIGTYEDKQENTVIYFIQNSNGNDQILRYFPDQARIDLQMEYDFGWTATTEITGIELINKRLLYWNDPKPRKINIEKARYILPDGTQKVKEWSLVLPKTISNLTAPYELYFKNENGTLIFGVLYDPASYTTREEFIQAIATNLNLVSSQSPVTAEACDCSLNFTEKVGGTVWIIESNNPTIVIPANWYGLTITDRMVDRAKYPPLYDPIGEYQQDDNYLYNYVKNKVFQFRLQYRYDDFENSALGVISQIPIDNLQCDGTNNPDKNYIDVDFNDPALLDQLTYSILTDVKVLAREQNDGNWKEIITLSPCEYLDYNGTNWVASYNFYNDIVSNTVADADVAKQYDDVPLTAEENILVKNRSILTNVVKGYDAPDCIPATWDVDVSEGATDLVTISGYIRIWNSFGDNNGEYGDITNGKGFKRCPIYQNANDDPESVVSKYPMYGGLCRGTYIDDKERYEGQIIPEGGFPVYLAGTQYFAISKQIQVKSGVAGTYLGVTNANGTIDGRSQQNLDKIQDFINLSNNPPYDQSDIYQYFEIRNVPKGKYIVRVASHWCSYGDKLSKGSMYDLYNPLAIQRTSTNIIATTKDGMPSSYKRDNYEFYVDAQSDVNVGTFYVCDQRVAVEGQKTTFVYYDNGDALEIPLLMWAINGYFVDSNSPIASTELEDLKLGVSPEKQICLAEQRRYGDWGSSGTLTGGDFGIRFQMTSRKTDHNGHFFTSVLVPQTYPNGSIFGVLPRVSAIKANLTTENFFYGANFYYDYDSALNGLNQLQLQTTTVGVLFESGFDASDNDFLELILPNTNPNIQDFKTFIYGDIVDTNSSPVAGVNVLFTGTGRYFTTGTGGNWQILIYADSEFNSPQYGQERYDYVIFNNDICYGTFSDNYIYCEVVPINNGGGYSVTNKFLVNPNPVVVDEFSDPKVKAHKRGGKYTYGIRYYDENGRFCSVAKAFEMYLPFITQDLNVLCIQDNYDLPNQYPVGTYKYGKPTINWHIAASQKAPEWAYYYQWMRTKNSIYGRYLQWSVNNVVYLRSITVDEIEESVTTYENGDSKYIKIGISNIVDYKSQNADSEIGYTFQEGDRLRLVFDRDGTYLNGLYDYEIISYDIDTQTITIKNENSDIYLQSGYEIEIMNPLSIVDNEEQIYYEVGEVYACTAPNTQNNQHSVLDGTFTNGDTYWRGRFVPVNDDQENFSSLYPLLIEDASVSDFYPSNSQDIGRAGVVDPNFKQIHYPTMMQHSGIYVEGSALNGLSSFETYNYKELNRAFGAIKRLFYVGNTLISIHENKVVANYIELRSLSDANTTDGLLAVSDAYFGNDRPMQSEYGCQHGKSAVQWNGLVYFLDAAKGVVCRYDNNGMDAISDKSMRSYFRDLCRDGVNKVRAVFDPYYRQYVVTIYAENGTKTIAWDEEKNRWTSEYSFIGEDYASVLRSIVSFKDGKLWLHDSNPIYNNFYGVQYSSQVKNVVVSGTNRSTYHTLTLQAVQADPLQNDWQALSITNEFNQQSRIKKPHFRLKENVWVASFLRDTTDTTVSNPIINGRNLRSQTLTILLDNDSTDAVYLQTVTTKVLPSERQ